MCLISLESNIYFIFQNRMSRVHQKSYLIRLCFCKTLKYFSFLFTQKHKHFAELKDMSGRESGKEEEIKTEETEAGAEEKKEKEDGASGSPADENGSPLRDTR